MFIIATRSGGGGPRGRWHQALLDRGVVHSMNAKLNVVLTPATPSVGLIDAQPGMPLIEGTLTAVSGNVVTVTRTDGSVFRDYAHNLRILALDAAGYGWPGAPECIRFGHGGGTGPAMVPSWRIGASPFETANSDELQTIMHGDGKPRTCRLGVSEAEDVAPVPACRGAVIGWAALATLLRRPAPWSLSLRTRGRCEVLMNYAGGVWATRPRPINCLRTDG
jgi:hypothetical protein